MIAISPRTRLQAQLRAVSGGKATQAPSRPKPMPTHATARRPFGRRVASGFQPRCGRTGDDASPPLTAPSPRSPWRDRARCPMVSPAVELGACGPAAGRAATARSGRRRRRARRGPGSAVSGSRRARAGRQQGRGCASRFRSGAPPKSSAERPTPTAVFRPSSATAIPVKPIVEAWMSLVREAELPAEDVERAGEAGERARRSPSRGSSFATR